MIKPVFVAVRRMLIRCAQSQRNSRRETARNLVLHVLSAPTNCRTKSTKSGAGLPYTESCYKVEVCVAVRVLAVKGTRGIILILIFARLTITAFDLHEHKTT